MQKYIPEPFRRALLTTLAVAAFHNPVAAQSPTEWSLPTGYPAGNFHTQNIQAFADAVAMQTKGQLRITVRPNGESVKGAEIRTHVGEGKVAIGEVFMSSLAKEMPIMGVDSVPFLARGYDEARKLWATTRPRVEQQLAERGLTVLFAVPWPPQGLFAARGIEGPQDFRGTVMRSYNPATEQLASLMGATPLNVPASELARALAEKRVKSFISSAATGLDVNAQEHMATFYDIQAWVPKNIVIVNTRMLNALAPALRQELLAAAKAAEAKGWELSEAKSKEFVQALATRGLKVTRPSLTLDQDLARIGEVMVRKWVREAPKADSWLVVKYEVDKTSRLASAKP
jgi:TRAP-type transport system periplasmic protein